MRKQAQDVPVPLPPNAMANTNPLSTGLQVGTLGAMAGMGWAAIHQAIRRNAGSQVPVDSIKPMVVGALIGAALGTTSGMLNKGKQSPRSPTWGGVENEIMERAGENAVALPDQSAYKYAGLVRIADRHAMQKMGQSAFGTAADIGSYFVPGVGQARMGWDTLSSLGRAAGSAFKGNWRQAGGHALSGLGSAAMFAGSMVPLVGQPLVGAAKALKGGLMAAKGIRAARQAAPLGLSQRLGHMAGPSLAKGPGGEKLIEGMENAGNKINNLIPKRWHTPLNYGSIPVAMGGDVIANMPEAAPRPPMAPPPSRWHIGPTEMPNMDFENIFQKRSQDYGSLMYNPALASKTLTDLYLAIRSDTGLPAMQKGQLVQQIQGLTGFAPESTPISALMIKGLGGTIGWLISKYFGMGPVGQMISAVGGFGLASSISNELNKPPEPYQGYHALGT